MFFVELKPATNNDILNVEYIQQCKIKLEPSKHRWNIVQCANCQLLPSQTEMHQLRSHLANQCHRKESSSDFRCALCGGNHPANYKGCMVYKGIQEKTCPPLWLKQYTPPSQIKHILYTQPVVKYGQTTKQNSYAPTKVEQEPHTNQPHQQTSDIQDLKNMMNLFEQMGTMLNLLITVITKLK
jgi:hypothetical protein